MSYTQGTHSNCIFKFPMFSLLFPWPTTNFPFYHNVWLLHTQNWHGRPIQLLEKKSGNLQLEQTKFPVFWQNFQIPCVFHDRDFCCCHFPGFPCAVGTLYTWHSKACIESSLTCGTDTAAFCGSRPRCWRSRLSRPWRRCCARCGRRWRWPGKSSLRRLPSVGDTWTRTSSFAPLGPGPDTPPPHDLSQEDRRYWVL